MVEPKTGATRPVNHKYTVTAETNDRGYVGFNAEFAASYDDGRVDVTDLGGRWDSVVSAKCEVLTTSMTPSRKRDGNAPMPWLRSKINLTISLYKRIVKFAAAEHLPSLHGDGREVEAGGLISYGASIPDLFHRAAGYVDKILRGARPADLPVEQPTKFELVINVKTANTLGLEVPPTLLTRADEVIE